MSRRIVIGAVDPDPIRASADATAAERANIRAVNQWARASVQPPDALVALADATDEERANIEAANRWAQRSGEPAEPAPLPEGQGAKVARVAVPVALGAGAGFFVAKSTKMSPVGGAAVGGVVGYLLSRLTPG